MSTPASRFIPGLHFYCDHRCWRCDQSARCIVHARIAAADRSAAGGPTASARLRDTPAGRVARVVLACLQVTLEVAERASGQKPGVARQGSVAGGPVPAGTDDESLGEVPVVAQAREYAAASLRVIQALRPALARRADPAANDAADRIEETCLTIASKVYRAFWSGQAASYAPDDQESDANGSAKVALLLIEESREAWRLLGAGGRGLANGTPSRFVAVLTGLETDLLSRFPEALAFVRPGFDERGAVLSGKTKSRAT